MTWNATASFSMAWITVGEREATVAVTKTPPSAKKFPVIIIDTPAAERGPDLEMFAALAGGALVVARQDSADPGALSRLQERLARCSAAVVATVLNSAR